MKLIKSEVLTLALGAATRMDKALTVAVAYEDDGKEVSEPTHYAIIIPISRVAEFTGPHTPFSVNKKDFE